MVHSGVIAYLLDRREPTHPMRCLEAPVIVQYLIFGMSDTLSRCSEGVSFDAARRGE